ncbi:MAG: alpha/beta fold hydrolase [Flavobacteriales bacterium]|nr:alpha/beta fold hydrolase [Flavobacteriales bacterium]MCB9168548.1 alpha/beta fold hydrolase [Flavobacteriales bacterium]
MDCYLVPGLGADHRLFARLDLRGHAVHYLDWPEMPADSTMRDFARRMAARVDTTVAHALIGVSMGGMVAQEMAALTRPEHVVIVSSWKGVDEMPWNIRMLRGSHPERYLRPSLVRAAVPVVRWQMGAEAPEDMALFDALIGSIALEQLKVQVAAVLGWPGPAAPVHGLVHIHGDEDRLMPIDLIKEPVVRVEGGTHFMVHTLAERVGGLIRDALRAR